MFRDWTAPGAPLPPPTADGRPIYHGESETFRKDAASRAYVTPGAQQATTPGMLQFTTPPINRLHGTPFSPPPLLVGNGRVNDLDANGIDWMSKAINLEAPKNRAPKPPEIPGGDGRIVPTMYTQAKSPYAGTWSEYPVGPNPATTWGPPTDLRRSSPIAESLRPSLDTLLRPSEHAWQQWNDVAWGPPGTLGAMYPGEYPGPVNTGVWPVRSRPTGKSFNASAGT